jgi:hypothetical protein
LQPPCFSSAWSASGRMRARCAFLDARPDCRRGFSALNAAAPPLVITRRRQHVFAAVA